MCLSDGVRARSPMPGVFGRHVGFLSLKPGDHCAKGGSAPRGENRLRTGACQTGPARRNPCSVTGVLRSHDFFTAVGRTVGGWGDERCGLAWRQRFPDPPGLPAAGHCAVPEGAIASTFALPGRTLRRIFVDHVRARRPSVAVGVTCMWSRRRRIASGPMLPSRCGRCATVGAGGDRQDAVDCRARAPHADRATPAAFQEGGPPCSAR